MTVDDLRKTLDGIPGHYPVWITVVGDEMPAGLVTQDKAIIRICDVGVDRVATENTLYDEAWEPVIIKPARKPVVW